MCDVNRLTILVFDSLPSHLPTHYSTSFLKDEYKSLCKSFEPHISVKVKEELSHGLMSVFHAEDIAEDVLAEIVVDEISSVENEHLTFR